MRGSVVILGAGVAGLAAAVALRRADFDVSVWEQSPGPSRSGMGFLLMENGVAALSRLGLAERAASRSIMATGSRIMHSDGTVVEERSFAPHMGMARSALIELLLEQLPDGVVEYSHEAPGGDQSDTNPFVRSGTTADLYVGADGQRSFVRDWVARGHGARHGHVAELISNVTAPDIVAKLGSTLLRFRHPDGGLGAGIVPTSKETLVWYITHDTRRWIVADDSASRRELAEKVANWPWPLPELIERTAFEDSYVWRTADMEPLDRFFRDNVVLVGDAAHPLLPFSTQGVNSALVDAVTLADVLEHSPINDATLSGWSRKRANVTKVYLEYGRARASAFLDPAAFPADPPFPESAGKLDLATLMPLQEN